MTLALALALVAGAGLATRWVRTPRARPVELAIADASTEEAPAAKRLRAPAFEEVELGVLTSAASPASPDRAAIEARIAPPLCGDESACAAVRAAVRDPGVTSIETKPASSWTPAGGGWLSIDGGLFSIDAGRAADGSATDRLVEVIRVRTATSPRRLALRTAIAVAAVLADEGGTVVDPLLGRSEDARTFAARAAIVEPLGTPFFRPDWIRLTTTAAAESVVRLRTVGLGRWGAPDVELLAIPESARDAGAQLVLAVASALARGTLESPVKLGANAGPDAAEEGDAEEDVDVALASVVPPPGEPGDSLARIEPPGGDGPVAALELVERVLGPIPVAPPDETTARARASTAQRALTRLFEAAPRDGTADASDDAGVATIWVRLPFAIPGGGVESLWVRVTGHDASTITGRIDDDPLAATDVARGDAITRPRVAVEAVRSR
jgi:hypothetical protein